MNGPLRRTASARWWSIPLAICVPLLMLLTACAGTEPPRWRVEAANASERFVEAWLVGERRVEQVEFERARERVARTGRLDLVARIELLRCAAKLAALVIEPCAGFEVLEAGLVAGPETVYADYLAGRLPSDAADRIALLPQPQRAIAALVPGVHARGAAALAAIDDPLSRLVAAAVLLRTGRATDAVVASAVKTATQQGWRRALLAWLTFQQHRAEAAGDAPLATMARRRIELMAPLPGAAGSR